MSRTFATRQQAVDWVAQVEDDIATGKQRAGRQSWVAASEKWRATRTLTRSDETRLRAIGRQEWAQGPLSALTPETLSGWRDARLSTVSPATVAREMTTIRSVIEFARRDLGWLSVNPIRDVRSPPEPPARRRLITDDELSAILKALGYTGTVTTVRHEVAVALLLALETAMRAGELLGLRWSDVAGNVATLPKTKNGDQRQVPLSSRAVALLESMRGRRLDHVRVLRTDWRIFHIDPDSLDVLFRRARKEAGLHGFTFHDSRATAITRLAQVLSPLELARMVGHRDLSSLLLYYAAPAASLAARLG
jgi:integrase